MKLYTIRNSFRDSGMWPVSCKRALKKMRQYSKKPTNTQDSAKDNIDMLPSLQPATYFQCKVGLGEWEDKMLGVLSSLLRKRFKG